MVTSNAATGYVAKISMLRLNIGSGMLRLSSCMLRLNLTSSVHACSGSTLPHQSIAWTSGVAGSILAARVPTGRPDPLGLSNGPGGAASMRGC